MAHLVAALSFISFSLSFFTRLPQIVRLISLKSSHGLSQTSLLLEIWNLSCNVSYSFYFALPYVEYTSLLLQVLVVLTLTIRFSPKRDQVSKGRGGTVLTALGSSEARTTLFVAIALVLHLTIVLGLTSSWVPMFFMATSLPLAPLSRLLQMRRIRALGPGSLSASSYSLQCICTLCRLTCVLLVSRDKLMIIKLATMTACNSALVILIVKSRKQLQRQRSDLHND